MSSPAPSSLSRPRSNLAATAVELRGECPRLTVDVLDAISNARRINRTELVNQILGEWAQQQLLEGSLLFRTMRGNPEAAEFFPATQERAEA